MDVKLLNDHYRRLKLLRDDFFSTAEKQFQRKEDTTYVVRECVANAEALDIAMKAFVGKYLDFEYRNYRIHYDPPPIPIRSFDWHFAHKDYDGPEDGRIGDGPTAEDCMRQIREYEYDKHEETL